MGTTFRVNYDEQLSALRTAVLQMGNIALEMVRLACDAVQTSNAELATQVLSKDDDVDRLEDACTLDAMMLVMRESPVGRDLKLLTATIGIVGEIEKVGDDAVKLARRGTKLAGVFPAELKVMFQEMGERARQAFGSSLRLYGEYSEELAQEIVHGDEAIDDLYQQARLRVEALIPANTSQTANLLRTIEAFHALEHVADHAVEIALRLKLHFSSG